MRGRENFKCTINANLNFTLGRKPPNVICKALWGDGKETLLVGSDLGYYVNEDKRGRTVTGRIEIFAASSSLYPVCPLVETLLPKENLLPEKQKNVSQRIWRHLLLPSLDFCFGNIVSSFAHSRNYVA